MTGTCKLAALGVALGLTSATPSLAAPLPLSTFESKAKGAWAGQMIGVSYGSAYEFNSCGAIFEGEIRDWQPEFVDNAIGQDDLYVEMTFLRALEDCGLDITDEEAGKAFAASEYGLWHANRAGRDNCRAGIMPPLSGHPSHNACADDIDFQIEADFCGILTPGLHAAANRLCDRFGHVMNYGDGVYGGMFVAGMYSAAYFESDVEKVVAAGLACIPRESKYAQLIRDVIACHARDPEDWRACWRVLEEKWAPYDLCGRNQPFNIDAKLNGGYIAIGLLYGDGDFAKTLEISTRCGQDNDCNPSNAAGALGCILGYEGIPAEYTAGLPAIADREFAYTSYSFDTLLEATTRLARQIVEANGGLVEQTAAGEVWQIKRQKPAPPKTLEQWIVIDNDLRLQATMGREGQSGVGLAWEPIPTATAYRVVRLTSSDDPGETVFSAKRATAFEDRAAPTGRALTYRVEVNLPEGGWQSSAPVRSFVFVPKAANEKGDTNLAREDFASADAAVLHPLGGGLRDVEVIRDGVVTDQNYDSFDGKNEAAEDWYAIRFARAVRANGLQYIEGSNFHDGGWWLSLTAQYLDPETFEWRDCSNVRLSPTYDFADRQEGRPPFTRWTLIFDPVTCAGIRVFGRPGGDADFTSIAELEVYWR